MKSLPRRLGSGDAAVIGLGSMLGAGLFSVWGPATAEAGRGLLAALALAGLVAWCNASSTARLAAADPEAGGAYLYGRRRLGPFWGVLAGTAFVVGKIASCAAMALAFGAYVTPDARRPTAMVLVVAVTIVNLAGVTRTAKATRVTLAVTLVTLIAAVVMTVAADGTPASTSAAPLGVLDVLDGAGLLFFAFAGYARIATLSEEVVDPSRTIPRAITFSIVVAFLLYSVTAMALLDRFGVEELARLDAPLAVEGGVVARGGAAVALAGVLLSLLAGVARTAMAMARDAVLPRRLADVRVAQALVSLAVGVVVVAGGLRGSFAVSAGSVLVYYGVANAAALTIGERRTRVVATCGLAGCAVLASAVVHAAV